MSATHSVSHIKKGLLECCSGKRRNSNWRWIEFFGNGAQILHHNMMNGSGKKTNLLLQFSSAYMFLNQIFTSSICCGAEPSLELKVWFGVFCIWLATKLVWSFLQVTGNLGNLSTIYIIKCNYMKQFMNRIPDSEKLTRPKFPRKCCYSYYRVQASYT